MCAYNLRYRILQGVRYHFLQITILYTITTLPPRDLPETARNAFTTTPHTPESPVIYSLPKILKPDSPGRSIASEKSVLCS